MTAPKKAPHGVTQNAVLARLQRANGKVVGVDVLADMLYGDHSPESRVNVRTVVHRLRKRGYRIDSVSLRPCGAPVSAGYRMLSHIDQETD